MRVKVTPRDGAGNPIPGAGSWESEVVSKKPVKIAMGGEVITAHLLKGGVQVPTSWCEAIPEITPEPGDICETDAGDIFLVEAETDGRFYDERGIGYDRADLRVLARKPLGAIEAHDAINAFFNALMDTDTQSGEVEAYKSFLRAILGTVYGRVDK